MNYRNIALLKILLIQGMQWMSIFNFLMISWVFVKGFGVSRLQGIAVVMCGAIIVGTWTVIYFKYFFAHELAINSTKNPEWNKLMEMQNNGKD